MNIHPSRAATPRGALFTNRRTPLAGGAGDADTGFIDTANPSSNTPPEPLMNTATSSKSSTLIKTLIAVTLVAVGAALFLPYRSETSALTPVVQLERVVIVGQRIAPQALQMAQLPRVVVQGKRVHEEPRSFAQLGRAISRLVKSV
jgi:hypothetical protein